LPLVCRFYSPKIGTLGVPALTFSFRIVLSVQTLIWYLAATQWQTNETRDHPNAKRNAAPLAIKMQKQ